MINCILIYKPHSFRIPATKLDRLDSFFPIDVSIYMFLAVYECLAEDSKFSIFGEEKTTYQNRLRE